MINASIKAANVHTPRKPFDEAREQEPLASEVMRLHAALRDLVPELVSRAEEIEKGRRVPADITDRLQRLGLFRTLLPRSHGGLELSVPEVLQLIETLAAADSSVGWVSMIGIGAQLFTTRLPRVTFDRIHADGRANQLAASGMPVGRAEVVDGGYQVSGRWPFASGCQNAQWIVGHCIVHKDGEPVMSERGPVTRWVTLPAERWRIEETWQASGLTGSGSHHVILKDVKVPEANMFDMFNGSSLIPGPLESPLMPFLASLHGAVANGIAAGAMADLAGMAGSGRRQAFATTDLRDSQVFQQEFGRLGAELRATRALLQVQADNHWRRALAGTLNGEADFAEGLQASAWIHAACTNIVSDCYTLGGTNAIMNASALQRRLRDIHAARQHAFAQERFYISAGKNALGFPPVDPMFGQ
ncbi:acyl-CoA dehydrogenase family protein [Bradyrhizobium diversitatis]|uniref:Acyl-CoA dehydrogenase family protein n=1 Tax=Bradyrhizobium diversitatis TaxID=2755406 RepID=A0ABS0NVN2_9BRAD|nr:acyl-CoA dehydrogenase family protein [Bradyrhizobium diversitatis]MBH5385034.1 acyl-CoA dehydrogenase family protein [Bradyrhizobium diversitatis]